ncbi:MULTISPECIES: flagellar biosynthesis anti-sigma factor FlgM [Pseudomonadaceae]|uniref:Negative regulator of flagellin synthesis n=1 Tax=Pseudomonas denitrificans TaxID=43306 RepID=A0A9X7R6T1_PSEDE|nr:MULTISPECIES: flagellar biosynthesis anti-sigma factor FlgM [Pseudomonadaceae]OQR31958.1 flagellar biosynthesis anti-sigma factor FlgM [Pseudomonas sp. T]MBD9514738.1 flagellar biosynthesis anti-sigma factor FlgM [Pseudomonas sp. PDM22]MBD9634081.1 flagellar biosynthesis anti-sigma factor FlgM [Pseudomonas sp. PDM19]MBD9685600.1 flagellar biosynthesis anti-sigma factor FlgM [Pseudomonas sp. PDM20]QEY74752.1 flagellar biosynthesis anti-sigma factor FlgM [Pseudomonas denitrificans (nom. rej.)
MEITRQLTSVALATSESAKSARNERAAPVAETSASAPVSDSLRLDEMQETLRAMPDVDQSRVAEIRRALMNGELQNDTSVLATSILSYHRGSDA